jgi:hypothetical protein
MKLSVCLIARDEEKNLSRALLSVSQVADEIILTDTGSTDRTVAIAQELGVQVGYFPWCDDFSAARNHTIGIAKGNWILWIDADEELLNDSQIALKNCISESDALAFFVSRRDLVDLNRPDQYSEMWQLRLFRNLPQLRFRGRCHPDFYPPIQEISSSLNLSVKTSSIMLRHHGYIGELRRQKLIRAAHLLELELKDRPDQLYYLIEYGRTLLQLKDARAQKVLELATRQVMDSREELRAPSPMVAALMEFLLQLPKKQLPDGLTPAAVRELCQRWFPRGAPLLWIMTQQAFEKEDFDQAEKLLRTLVRMGEDKSYDRTISFDPRIIGEDARLNLGVCLIRQGKLTDAQQLFDALVEDGLRVVEAKANLKVVNRLRLRYSGRGKSTCGKRRKPKIRSEL